MRDATTAPGTRTRLELISDPDDIVHLVCCRDVVWRVAFCGAEETKVNPAAETACTMCVEEARAMLPDFDAGDHPRCPVDGNPCPDEHEIDLRIARETGND